MEKRIVDYIADFIHDRGVDHVFMLTGGGAMFLNDGVALHKDLKGICMHHEQSCAMAATAYAKHKPFGVCMPTTGCGGTNALTGLLDAWQDSVPVLFISGQVNYWQTSYSLEKPVRHFGVQEANIVDVVKPMTKYAAVVSGEKDIRKELEKAYHIMMSDRPGPVWLDIPMNIQSSKVDWWGLEGFIDTEPEIEVVSGEIEDLINNSERPVILAGSGINRSNSRGKLKCFIDTHNIPVVTTFGAIDVLDGQDPKNIGTVGIKGSRAGNFTLQNSDLVICLGTSLSVPVTGYRYNLFAPYSKKVVVDIDEVEHQKGTVEIDLFLKSDLNEFLDKDFNITKDFTEWGLKTSFWKASWPLVSDKNWNHCGDNVDLYAFMDSLNERLDDHLVSDAGSAYYVTSQAAQMSNAKVYNTPVAQAEMGATIPYTIGAAIASGERVIGITGDGSFQLNFQELAVIKNYNLPIKIFVWNNGGYLSIRNTQDKYFEGRRLGTDTNSGLFFPSIQKIAEAYNFDYEKIENNGSLGRKMEDILSSDSPCLIEVMCRYDQKIEPFLSAKKLEDGSLISTGFENMAPFLDEEEIERESYYKWEYGNE